MSKKHQWLLLDTQLAALAETGELSVTIAQMEQIDAVAWRWLFATPKAEIRWVMSAMARTAKAGAGQLIQVLDEPPSEGRSRFMGRLDIRGPSIDEEEIRSYLEALISVSKTVLASQSPQRRVNWIEQHLAALIREFAALKGDLSLALNAEPMANHEKKPLFRFARMFCQVMEDTIHLIPPKPLTATPSGEPLPMPVSGGELIDFLYSAAFPSTGDSPSKFSKLLRKAKGRLDALAKANYPHGYTEEDGEIIPLVYDPKFGITYNPADLSRDD